MRKNLLGIITIIVLVVLVGNIFLQDYTKANAIATFALMISILTLLSQINGTSYNDYSSNKVILDEFLVQLFYFSKYFSEKSPQDEINPDNIATFRTLFNKLVFPKIEIYYAEYLNNNEEFNLNDAKVFFYVDNELKSLLLSIYEAIRCENDGNQIDYKDLTKNYKEFNKLLDKEIRKSRKLASLKEEYRRKN